MTQCDSDYYKQELLIKRIATTLGFRRLSEFLQERSDTLPRIPPSYLLIAFALILQMGFLDSYNYLIGKNSIADDPGRLFITIGTVLAVVGVRWMNKTYSDSITALQLQERGIKNNTEIENSFRHLIPFRVKVWAYIMALTLLYVNLFVLLGLSTVIEIEGVIKTIIENFLILPLVQVPLMVDLGLLYIGIHLLLPSRITQADLNMFFYDPQNMGGFGPIGQLLKRSYYLYTTGLLLYFGMVYWPQILTDVVNVKTAYPEPTQIVAVFFTILWVLGICSIAYSMYRMHTLMSRKKQEAIRNIKKDIKEHLEDPFDITTDHLKDPELRDEFEHKIATIRNTKRYPSTFTMWSQILISVLLPQAMQVALQIVP